MTGLAEFLTARLAEDEAAANRVSGHWRLETTGEIVASDGTYAEVCAEAHWTGVGHHIARHDPARVLREVEAKRKILAARGAAIGAYDAGYDAALQFAMGALAVIWDDHPDYDPAWAPS
jgi:hypothetical protein